MHPRLSNSIDSYPLFLALAVVVGTAVALSAARGADPSARRFIVLLLVLGGAALGGAKLYSILERGEVRSLTWEIGNGYRHPGGIAAWLAAMCLLPRISGNHAGLLDLADILAPALGFGTATARLGCFLEGCCSGTVSRLPWALSFPAGSPAWRAQVAAGLIPNSAAASLPVHPLQIYFFIASSSIGILSFRLLRRKASSGQVILLCLALDNATKFLLESLRDPYEPHLQLTSLLLAGASATLLLVLSTAKARNPLPVAGASTE